jgi:hypothetical protein
MTPAQGRRQREELMRAIAREIKGKNRDKLVDLRGFARKQRASARAATRAAVAQCRADRRKLPTLAALAAQLRKDKADARSRCDLGKQSARGLKDDAARARAELAAERDYQKDLRRIEAGNRAKQAAHKRPGLARTRQQESDDEVRGNIPPELVGLWERVKRSIKGDDRKTRTEAFLQYAEEHPGEEWAALEDSVDRAIAEMERRQAMPNPKKKKHPKKAKKAKARAPKRVTVKTRTTTRKKVVIQNPKKASLERSVRSLKARNAKLTKKLAARKNPRRPPKRWFDHCLASVAARKYARDPAAVCSAAWWKQKPAKRAAIVRRLERGTPRQRRFAVGIAKAEQKRADGPPRKKNPGGMCDGGALAEYERTHWGKKGRGAVRTIRAADPRHGTAVALGKLVAVVYRTEKAGDDEPTDYEHEFEGPLPTLAYNPGGLIVAGGGYRIKEDGIDG